MKGHRPVGVIRSRTLRRVSVVGAALAFTACSLLGTPDPPRGDVPCCGGSSDDLQVTYLGVGGWIFGWRGQRILTGPFYTNPSSTRVGFSTIYSDTALVERLLPDVEDVQAILVGHAHYDHLMDVPYVAARRAPNATVYVNQTGAHILAAALPSSRTVAVNAAAGTPEAPGRWIPVGSGIRFMAIETLHAPHFPGLALYDGTIDAPLQELPSRASGWKGGVAYAFLIDFLDVTGQVAYRIHYQDLASSEPWGLIPPLPARDQHPVNVAVLCPPSFERVTRYPEAIVENAMPEHVFLGHWEDFFDAPEFATRSVPLTDLGEFTRRLEAVLPAGATWTLPRPNETFAIR